MDEVLEHTQSKVTMKCDFTEYFEEDDHAKVEWFHEDKRIEITPQRTIKDRVSQ